MLRSLFSAISGMRNSQTFLDVVGNNIANVNTTGFKYSQVTFRDIISQTQRGAAPASATSGAQNPVQVGLGASIASIEPVHTQGGLQYTGKETDLAIQGNGFFVLNSADGSKTAYSRDGSFFVDANGMLTQGSTAYHLAGQSGPIPTDGSVVSLSIGEDGSINGIMQDGTTTSYGQIQLAYFANPAGLVKSGNNLYTGSPSSGTATTGNPGTGGLGTVEAGFLEMSNVDLAAQFSNLIIAERGFQANARVITASDEVLQDLVNMKR